MEKDLLENFVVKINDLQKDINKNYKMEFGNITNPYEYQNSLNEESKIINTILNKTDLDNKI